MHSFYLPIRRTAIVLTMMAAFILNACTANTSSTDEHGLLPHLSVDMRLPSKLSPGSSEQFRIVVSQGGEPVQADDVTFEFWPEEHPEQRVEIAGESGGNGLYSAVYRLSDQGLYVVRCRVSSSSLEAMPTKRFAIGEEAVLRLAALEGQQMPDSGSSSEGHHH